MIILFYFILFFVSRYKREVSLYNILKVNVSSVFDCIFEFAHEAQVRSLVSAPKYT
jgi:hypothetical protein